MLKSYWQILIFRYIDLHEDFSLRLNYPISSLHTLCHVSLWLIILLSTFRIWYDLFVFQLDWSYHCGHTKWTWYEMDSQCHSFNINTVPFYAIQENRPDTKKYAQYFDSMNKTSFHLIALENHKRDGMFSSWFSFLCRIFINEGERHG